MTTGTNPRPAAPTLGQYHADVDLAFNTPLVPEQEALDSLFSETDEVTGQDAIDAILDIYGVDLSLLDFAPGTIDDFKFAKDEEFEQVIDGVMRACAYYCYYYDRKKVCYWRCR